MAKLQDRIIAIFRSKNPLQKDAKPFSSQDDNQTLSDNDAIQINDNGNNLTRDSFQRQLSELDELQNQTSSFESISPIKEDALAQLGFNHIQNEVAPRQITQMMTQAQTVINISNAKGIHLGDTYVNTITNSTTPQPATSTLLGPQNSSRRVSETSSRTKLKKTPTIVAMLESNQELEYRLIKVIAKHLYNWKQVARELQYSEGQIQAFELDNHAMGVTEVCIFK